MTEPDILRGWKEIERYVGLTRKNIISCGYPVHREERAGRDGVSVFAVRRELLDHALGRPLLTKL